jgi:hypothetical protein
MHNLFPVEELRRTNKRDGDSLIATALPVVSAWCKKNDVTLPAAWVNEHEARDEITRQLSAQGVYDFRRLVPQDFLRWLLRLGFWPEKMPLSTVLDVLGLSQSDLDVIADREERAREAQEKQRRSLEFNGKPIDPDDFNPGQLADQLASELSESLANESRFGDTSELGELSGRGGGGGGGKKKGGSKRVIRVHPKKAALIGFLGELIVYYWLKSCFPSKDIDAAWVSTNRTKLLTGEGSDSLGYDFKIRFRDRLWFLEVKTSVGDPLEFELGETEIRSARECAIKKNVEYSIIYVSNVEDTQRLKIEQLPNPLAEQNVGRYRLMGEGLRYRFARSDLNELP